MDHWEIIKTQAIKHWQSKTIFTSFIEKAGYSIDEVRPELLILNRLEVGGWVKMGKKSVNTAIDRLRLNAFLPKTKLISSVVRETTLIIMHPNIYWDHQSKTIHWKQGNKSSALNTELKDAVDDELEKMWRLVNQRMHQSRFKKNISYLYNGRCAISGSSVPEVLDAAHISGHKVSGNNKNKNGILMRTDLHRLFDRNLLLIHPDRLTVHLHPGIKDKTYTTFEGQPISKPKNDNLPAKEFLQEKWNNAGWTTNL